MENTTERPLFTSSQHRYRATATERRLYGGVTVTVFLVGEVGSHASTWREVKGYGPTPGERASDAKRYFRLLPRLAPLAASAPAAAAAPAPAATVKAPRAAGPRLSFTPRPGATLGDLVAHMTRRGAQWRPLAWRAGTMAARGRRVLEAAPAAPGPRDNYVVRCFYENQGGELLAMDSGPLPAVSANAMDCGGARSVVLRVEDAAKHTPGDMVATGKTAPAATVARLVINPSLCAPVRVAEPAPAPAEQTEIAAPAPVQTSAQAVAADGPRCDDCGRSAPEYLSEWSKLAPENRDRMPVQCEACWRDHGKCEGCAGCEDCDPRETGDRTCPPAMVPAASSAPRREIRAPATRAALVLRAGDGSKKPGKVALKSIKIEWSESSALTDGAVFSTFAAASVALSAAARTREPYAGGYYKTSVLVEWADGETYQARIDLQHELHGHLANVVGTHIREFCEFSSGRKCPPTMTPEQHEAYMRATDPHAPRAGFAVVLDGYALDDGMPTIDGRPAERPAPVAPVEPTPEEKRASRGEGAKYRSDATLADIKRGIVADIKAAVADKTLPAADYKVSAAKSRGSMCSPDVSITVDGLPFPVMHPEKREVMERDGNDNAYHGPWGSPEVGAVYDKVRAIAKAYGYDRSDSQSDYFDYAFNVSVKFPASTREYTAAAAVGQARVRERVRRPDFIDWTLA